MLQKIDMQLIVAFASLIIFLLPTNLSGKESLIIFSGDLRGEIKPCGCAEEGDMGGLPRRHTYFNQQKSIYSNLLYFDLGNNFPEPSEQGDIKIKLIQAALKKLNPKAILVGPNEFLSGLNRLDSKIPYLLSNQGEKLNFLEYKYIKNKGEKIAIFGYLSPNLVYHNKNDPPLVFDVNKELISNWRKKLETKKESLKILLFRGNIKELKKFNASGLFDLIVAGSNNEDELNQVLKLKLDSGDVPMIPTKGQAIFSLKINDFGRIPYSNNLIAWLEFDKDPRWDKRVFSRLKILDINSTKIYDSSLKGFFSSADLSPDGKRVLVAKNNLDGSQGFEEYNLNSMQKIRDHRFGKGVFSSLKYQTNNKIIGIKTLNGVKSVFLFDLKNSLLKEVYKTNKNIGWPSVVNNRLIFSVEKKEFEEILCVNLETQEVYMVKETQLGNYYPSIKENKIVFSSMGSSGFNVYTADINQLVKILDYQKNIYKSDNNQKQIVDYESKKTNMFLHFIKPVSWAITDLGLTNNFKDIFSGKLFDNITLGLESENLFGSFLFKGGYKIDIRDKKPQRFFGFSYQGLYPILDFEISNSQDFFKQNIVLTNNQGDKDTIYDADINFKIKEINSSVKIPLSFTRGKFFSSFLSSFGYSHQKFKDFYTTSLTSESGRFPLTSSRDTRAYVSGLFLVSRKHKKSKRQVYTPHEQTLLLEAKKTTPNSDYQGWYLRSDLYLAFPGITTLHSTRLKFRGEAQDDQDYLFRNNINFIYGYDNSFRFSSFLGWGLEYEIPLFYPDFSIGPIAYIQRVRGMGFINGGTAEGASNYGGVNVKESPKSVGIGITLDLNLFRQTFMFDLGLKYAYVFGVSNFKKGPNIEITLGSITF